jgi:hypothetical protein
MASRISRKSSYSNHSPPPPNSTCILAFRSYLSGPGSASPADPRSDQRPRSAQAEPTPGAARGLVGVVVLTCTNLGTGSHRGVLFLCSYARTYWGQVPGRVEMGGSLLIKRGVASSVSGAAAELDAVSCSLASVAAKLEVQV